MRRVELRTTHLNMTRMQVENTPSVLYYWTCLYGTPFKKTLTGVVFY